MQKEEIVLQKRLLELSRVAYQKGIVTYSDFLNLNELNILHTTPKNEFFTQYETFGGYSDSERQMVAFLPDALYYAHFYPIKVLKISPLQKKFAESLSHRDYLGAILNLGIDRCKLGDILLIDGDVHLFVQESLADFICRNLTRIRHTSVYVEVEDEQTFSYTPAIEEIKGTVASVRLDSLLSLVFLASRSKLVPLIEGGRVFVNGKLITTNSYNVKENDIVSVRKLGRFRYKGVLSQTKKGRYYVLLEKYI